MPTYIVTYNTNGGTSVSPTYGDHLPSPLPTTAREDYTFATWYYDEEFEHEAHAGDLLLMSVTLYARWYPNIYYQTNGGSAVQNSYGDNLPYSFPSTTKTGYRLEGWYYTALFTRQAFEGDPITRPVDLYAKWVAVPVDPYAPGGYVSQDGGNGTWTTSSDTVTSPLPLGYNISTTKLISVLNPTATELGKLSDNLYSDGFFKSMEKWFGGSFENYVISLGIIPGIITSTDRGSPMKLYAGNIYIDVKMAPLVVQFKTINMGSITIDEFFGNFMDYENTTIEIYIPFVGFRTLETQLVMGKTITLKYNVDMFTGAFVANIEVDSVVMYSYNGMMMSSVPITGENWQSLFNSIIDSISLTGGTISRAAQSSSGDSSGAAAAGLAMQYIGGLMKSVGSAMRPMISRTGNLSTMVGMMAPRTPYLIITRGMPAVSENQRHFEGYTSYITATLNTLSGYTEVSEIHLEGVSATSDELNEIETLLKRGVII